MNNEDALSINQQLKNIIREEEILERFENQRKNIGKAYSLAAKIREASKDGAFTWEIKTMKKRFFALTK